MWVCWWFGFLLLWWRCCLLDCFDAVNEATSLNSYIGDGLVVVLFLVVKTYEDSVSDDGVLKCG